jgi:FAD/FMN-containing dehydrogenase
VLASFADARAGQGGLEAVLASGLVPAAIEYLDAGALAAAGRGGAGFALLCDVEGDAAAVARDQAELAGVLREAGATRMDAPDDGRELWRWREGVSLAVVARRGGKLSEDVAVPLDRLADAVEETLAIGARHGLEACSWGHAGDGNLHSTFLLEPGNAAQLERAEAAAEELFDMAVRLGGTVSGEHGLGRLKAGRLARQWPPAALEAHRAIKRALDPKGLFNPGKKVA